MNVTDSKPESPTARDLAACLDCGSALGGCARCPGCSREYPWIDGILEAIGPLTGRNRVAADFYDGPSWPRFRPWERLFLRIVGGPKKARGEILAHLPEAASRVLEVGIGDGENLAFLAGDRSIYGLDLARRPLEACALRFPTTRGRLVLAEAEAIPFPDASFDACFTVGGFNYFRDPAAAVREMRRVTRPGGVVVVADERSDLKRFGLGHLIGLKAYDAWWMRRVGLPPEFVSMVLSTELDLDALIRETWPEADRLPIWRRLGYCLVEGPRRERP